MAAFEQLDFLYMPERGCRGATPRHFVDVLGGRLVFAIEATGTRVAMVELTDGPPRLLLTDHLEGDRPILIYRVADLEAASPSSTRRGWEPVGLRSRSRPARAPRSAAPVGSGSPCTNGRARRSRPTSRDGATSELREAAAGRYGAVRAAASVEVEDLV